jgi:diguanylate cyclase (GGDEF)-like protein
LANRPGRTPGQPPRLGHSSIHAQAAQAETDHADALTESARHLEPSRVERLLELWRPYRPRRLTPRERRVEAILAVGFVAVAAAMALGISSDRTLDVPVAAGLIVSLALASRVRLYMGAGYAMPTQLVLVPMLYLLPATDVPACVALGLLAGAAVGRPHPERLLTAVVDAWHAVGPSLVFVAGGEPDPTLGSWPLLLGALAAQCATDVLATTAREWLGRGIPPSLQTRVLVSVYGVDACLSAVALPVAVASADGGRFGFVLVLPLVALLAALMAERQRRIERAIVHLDELERQHARLDRTVHRIGEALASKLDRTALLDLLLQTAVEALEAEHGRIGALAWAAVPGSRPPEALALAERAALEGDAPEPVQAGRQFAIAHPLGGDRVLAIARAQPFTPEERALLDYLAGQAAVALENLALHDRLSEQATRDELTGLANHRRFQQVLAQEIAHANRGRDPLSLAMFDIDDFKAVNDTHGHQQGDLVLQHVAAAIARTCRATDEPARYGGEELAVVLPSTDLEGAHTLAEAIRGAVEAVAVPLPGGGAIRVTVSAGVGSLEAGASDPAALIEAADGALYAAKRAGKNSTARGGWVRAEAAAQARRFERTPSPRP